MGDIFNRLVDMNTNEILNYRFMPTTVGSGKLIKDLNNIFRVFSIDFGAKVKTPVFAEIRRTRYI